MSQDKTPRCPQHGFSLRGGHPCPQCGRRDKKKKRSWWWLKCMRRELEEALKEKKP